MRHYQTSLDRGIRHILILLLTAALACSSGWLHAAPLDDEIATLKKAMKRELADKEGKGAPGSPYGYGGGRFPYAGAIDAMLANLESSGDVNAQASLQQILAQFSSPAVQKAGQDLLAEIQREQQAKVAAYTASVDEVVNRVAPTVLAASKTSDLDQLLVDLQKVQQTGRDTYGMEPGSQRASQRAGSAYQFVAGWQDYLSYLGVGKIQEAQNELRSLAQNNYEGLVVPRSEILDRANQLNPGAAGNKGGSESAEQIVDGIQSLDDMAPALQRIKALPPNTEDPNLGNVIQNLQHFVMVYDNAKAGLPLAFEFGYPVYAPQFDNPKIHKELWFFLFEHEFERYKGPPATEDQPPLEYLENVFTDAEQREDWHELQQAYLARSYLERTSLFSTGQSPRDMTGFESMLAGLNQETAGQYAPAVVSYEQALKFPNTYLPAKFIGDRLNNIQKNHPAEYADGLQLSGLAPAGSAASAAH